MTSRFMPAALLAATLLTGFCLAPALAQNTTTPAVDRAQQAIGSRIAQGLASGHITPSEARDLYRRDRDIEMRENRFKANGNATPQERQQLRAELDSLAAEVERKMLNNDFIAQPNNNSNNANNTPGINNRQENISERIEQGLRSGRLTRPEARRLQRQERDIARAEASYKRDGVVTAQERQQLRNALSRLNNELTRLLRNNR